MFQRLGLTNALIAIARDVLDEFVNTFEGATVLGLSPEVVLPCRLIPDQGLVLVLNQGVLQSLATCETSGNFW